MVLITSLKNSENIAKKIAKELNVKYIQTQVDSFPDGDIYLKYKSLLKKEILIIIESFQPNSNQTLLNIQFAAKAAKMQGAKKIVLVSPYLAFMRQDKEFNPGEAINAQIMANILNNSVDKFITVDPHLHRILKMKDVFTIPAKNLTANSVIGNFINKKYSNKNNLLIMGPDWESYQWANEISKQVGVEDTVLHKDRHSGRNVDVKLTEKIDLTSKNIVIVDDIISTGNTMIKAAIKSRKLGAKSITAIGVHGLFVENGLKKMQKYFDNIYTVNTITHETNKIDITPVLVNELSKII